MIVVNDKQKNRAEQDSRVNDMAMRPGYKVPPQAKEVKKELLEPWCEAWEKRHTKSSKY